MFNKALLIGKTNKKDYAPVKSKFFFSEITVPPIHKYTFKNCLISSQGVVLFPFPFNIVILRVNLISKFKFLIIQYLKRPVVRLDDNLTYVCANNGYDHYYHWLIDILPLYLAGVDKKDTIIMPHASGDFQKESLEMLGFKNLLLLDDHVKYSIKKYITFTPHLESRPHVALIQKTVEAIKSEVPKVTRSKKRIYVSRKGLKRNVINENEFLPLLRKLNFEFISLDELSFKEQVRLFRGCDLLMGPHGAALTNAVFMEKGSKLIELVAHEDSNTYQWHFYHLSQIVGLDYYSFNCEKHNLHEDPHMANLVVNSSDFETFLSKVLEQ